MSKLTDRAQRETKSRITTVSSVHYCATGNCPICRAQRDVERREQQKKKRDELTALAHTDFESWFWAEQIALRTMQRVDPKEAAHAVSIAVLRIAAVRMRALGLDLREVLAVVQDAWNTRKVPPKKESDT